MVSHNDGKMESEGVLEDAAELLFPKGIFFIYFL